MLQAGGENSTLVMLVQQSSVCKMHETNQGACNLLGPHNVITYSLADDEGPLCPCGVLYYLMGFFL